MRQKITLRPLAQIDSHILEILKQSLTRTFKCPVEIEALTLSLEYAYEPKRKQYLAPQLLATLRSFSIEPGDRCLGIVDVDLYAPGLNFIFGEADITSGWLLSPYIACGRSATAYRQTKGYFKTELLKKQSMS